VIMTVSVAETFKKAPPDSLRPSTLLAPRTAFPSLITVGVVSFKDELVPIGHTDKSSGDMRTMSVQRPLSGNQAPNLQ
jgi:hypothetical protein